jgi:hypothetical protein
VQRDPQQRERTEGIKTNLDTELATIVRGPRRPIMHPDHERGVRAQLCGVRGGLRTEPVTEADYDAQRPGGSLEAMHRTGRVLPVAGVPTDPAVHGAARLARGPLNETVGVLHPLRAGIHNADATSKPSPKR